MLSFFGGTHFRTYAFVLDIYYILLIVLLSLFKFVVKKERDSE